VAIIAIIICAVVAVISIAVVLILWLGNGSPEPQLVEIPKLVGKDYYALDAEDYPDVQIKLLEEMYDDVTPAGIILEQDPADGTQAEPGKTVFVTVSLGAEPKFGTMSDLTDYTQEAAESYLDRLDMGLQIRVEREHSEEIELGKVIRTEPAFGGSLEEGQEVVLYISLGIEIKNGIMPNVVDVDEDLAKRTLENQNLRLDVKTEEIFDSEIEIGNVVKTDPEKGDPLTTGQEVTLYISKGPETKEMPDLVGKDIDTATSLLEYGGFKAPIVEEEFSEEVAEGLVISQSEEAKAQVDITKEITLVVSKGPEPTEPTEIFMDVTIDLRGYADEADCQISIYYNSVEVFNATVEKGTESIVLEDQTGLGMQKYVVIINDAETWDEWVDFTE